MRKHGNLFRAEPVLQKLFFGETAGSQEMIDAFLVSAQPAMEIGFGHQQKRRTGRPGITAFGENVPELPAATALASMSFGHHVVSRAKQLEVVQVIDHRHAQRIDGDKW